jgi:hypothetical protein
MTRRVERVAGISRDALYVDERYEPEEFRCTRWRSDQTSEKTCCKHCYRPLTAYGEIRDGVHPECEYAAEVIANTPKATLAWGSAVARLRVSDCEMLKLYRFRWPSSSESKVPDVERAPSRRCACSEGHTGACRQRKHRERLAKERQASGEPVRARGRPCKPGGPRRAWASAWLAPRQVDWMRRHGLGIADYLMIRMASESLDAPLDQIACFARLLERDAAKGNENARRLVAWLRSVF